MDRTFSDREIESFYAGVRTRMRDEYPDMDLVCSELLFNLIRTFTGVQSRLTQLLQPHGITLPGFNVLTLLGYHPAGLRLNEIGQLLLVSRANVTGLIDSLERKGLVARLGDDRDRRVFIARITAAGETLLRSFRPSYLSLMKNIGSSVTDSEKKELAQLLAKFRKGVEQLPSKASFQDRDDA